jgi:putative flippase GtrA
MPLPIAAVFGFAAAAAVNYVLHESWTFRHGARRLSLRRGGLYLTTLCLTLGARIGAVLIIQRALLGAVDHKLATLLAATGISFLVNYGLSRYVVFTGRPHGPKAPASGEVRMSDTGRRFPDTWQIPEFSTLLLGGGRREYALGIPVINEGERIRHQLLRIQAADLPVDVIVADGGSTDGSLDADFVAAAGVRAVLTKTGPGRLSAQLRMAYAWCLMQGYSGIVTIDRNGKDNVEAVSGFVARLASGKDYVQGSR